ncbi:MAG: hypothetical protein H0U74_00715 [Bradymonadaceae bacterium]|nr:hypothetical protein [Lujinxingiaceae bacterium]
MDIEKFLASLVGDDAMTRVEVVQVAQPGQTPTLEIRLERHAGDLGWQTHRRIRLAAGQIGQLREALNMMDVDARDARIAHNPRTEADSNVVMLPLVRKSSSI